MFKSCLHALIHAPLSNPQEEAGVRPHAPLLVTVICP